MHFQIPVDFYSRSNLLPGGAPTALVSLIGSNQYRRCARDIYYFLQVSLNLRPRVCAFLQLTTILWGRELLSLTSPSHLTMFTCSPPYALNSSRTVSLKCSLFQSFQNYVNCWLIYTRLHASSPFDYGSKFHLVASALDLFNPTNLVSCSTVSRMDCRLYNLIPVDLFWRVNFLYQSKAESERKVGGC